MKISEWSIGKKLGGGFGAVAAILLLALGVALYYNGQAQNAWKQTLRWNAATAGAAHQIEGIQLQMTAQAMYVATGDEQYRTAFEDGGTVAEAGAKAVDAVGAPVIGRIATSANAADRLHDKTVHDLLMPAVQ